MVKRQPVSTSSSFQVRKGRVFAMVGKGKKNIPIDSGSNKEQDPGDTCVIAIIKTRLVLYQEQTILPLILCTK